MLAWIWLDVALTVQRGLDEGRAADFHQGKLSAMRYFFAHELPKVAAWLSVVSSRDATCREMQDNWF